MLEAKPFNFGIKFHRKLKGYIVAETQSKAVARSSLFVSRAPTDVEIIKAHANAELLRLKAESQRQVSMRNG